MVRMGGMSRGFGGNRGFNNIQQFQFGPAWKKTNNYNSTRSHTSGNSGRESYSGGGGNRSGNGNAGGSSSKTESKPSYYFSYSRTFEGYDIQNYKPELSNGRITKEQCEALTTDLSANLKRKEKHTKPLCCGLSWATVLATIVFSFTYLGFVLAQAPAYGRSKELSNGLPVLFLVGPAVLIFQIWIDCRTKTQLYWKKNQIAEMIVQKHLRTTFAGAEVSIKVLVFYYVQITFNWPSVTPEMLKNQDKAQETQAIDDIKVDEKVALPFDYPPPPEQNELHQQ